MGTENALLHEIQENPQDDLPKLMYADWLEEEGDFLGAGVRWLAIKRKHPAYQDGDYVWTLDTSENPKRRFIHQLPRVVVDELKPDYRSIWDNCFYSGFTRAFLDAARAIAELLLREEL